LSRAIKFIDAINDAPDLISPNDPATNETFLESLRTLIDSLMVVWCLRERPRRVNPFPADRLQMLLEGADLASADTNTRPRDIQFELSVGSFFIMGGADIRPVEPDYDLLFHMERLGIAVKRLSSIKPARVLQRLRKATRQIETSTGTGFVAMNLDSWINDLGADNVEGVGEQFNAQLQDAHREIAKVSGRDALRGVLVLANWSQWSFDGPKPQIEYRNPTQFIPFGDPEDENVAQCLDFMDGVRARFDASLGEISRLMY